MIYLFIYLLKIFLSYVYLEIEEHFRIDGRKLKSIIPKVDFPKIDFL